MSAGPLRAPQDDGSILVHPQPADIGPLLERNRRVISASKTALGLPLEPLRRQAAADVLRLTRAYHQSLREWAPEPHDGPLIVAGHQPELFHPGVWLKNFALNGIARRHRCVAVNLVVDSDAIKRPGIDVPVVGDDPAEIRTRPVTFDSIPGGMTFESWRVQDDESFRSFAGRVGDLSRNWPFTPLLGEFWNVVLQAHKSTACVRDLLSGARREYERRWGCANLEVPLSSLMTSPAIAEFIVAMLRHLPAVHEHYNAAIADYRRRRRLRSRQHPAPDLARDGDWLEAPFWGVRRGSARRERLFVRAEGGRLHLRAGRDTWPDLPANADGTLLQKLNADGFRLQTRALTTTLISRLLFADAFMHGIGGAKYDEVTDAIIERWTGSPPPGILLVSGTLQLPFTPFLADAAGLHDARRRVRDLDWNPQRELGGEWIQRHDRLAAIVASSRAERRDRYRQWRALNEEMRPLVANERADAEQVAGRLAHEMAANSKLRSRDFSFALFPESKLRPFLQQVLNM